LARTKCVDQFPRFSVLLFGSGLSFQPSVSPFIPESPYAKLVQTAPRPSPPTTADPPHPVPPTRRAATRFLRVVLRGLWPSPFPRPLQTTSAQGFRDYVLPR